MGRAQITDEVGLSAVLATRGENPSRDQRATAVRYTLQLLAERAPGNTVEVRVPPFGATQCIEGPRHTRGTPPNVIEMNADTWMALCSGELAWAEALAQHRVQASGQRAHLDGLLPLLRGAFSS